MWETSIAMSLLYYFLALSNKRLWERRMDKVNNSPPYYTGNNLRNPSISNQFNKNFQLYLVLASIALYTRTIQYGPEQFHNCNPNIIEPLHRLRHFRRAYEWERLPDLPAHQSTSTSTQPPTIISNLPSNEGLLYDIQVQHLGTFFLLSFSLFVYFSPLKAIAHSPTESNLIPLASCLYVHTKGSERTKRRY